MADQGLIAYYPDKVGPPAVPANVQRARAITVCEDLATLTTLDVDSQEYISGCEFYTRVEGFLYVLNRESTDAVSSPDVIAAPGGGRFIRVPTASGGNVQTLTQIIPFTFQSGVIDVGPATIAGNQFFRATVRVDVPFTDVAATIEVGTVPTPALVMGTTDSTLSVAANYTSLDVVPVAAVDVGDVRVTVSPGASVAGSGIVFIQRTQ